MFATFSQDDSRTEAHGFLASPIMGWRFLLFDPQGVFLSMCSQGGCLDCKEDMWSLYLLPGQNSAPLCPSITAILKCPPEAKPSSLPCSWCYPIWKCKEDAGYRNLTCSPPISCLKKYKQEASCKCLTWSPPISCLHLTRVKAFWYTALLRTKVVCDVLGEERGRKC